MTKENKNKVWGTRVKKPTSKLLQSINSSIDIDKRLFNEDIDASIAHCEMLSKQKIIKNESAKKIIFGLKKIKIEIQKNKFQFKKEYEDIHLNIEKRLFEIIGDHAGFLHTARSRNDQVVTDFKLWIKKSANNVDKNLTLLIKSFLNPSFFEVKFLSILYEVPARAADPKGFSLIFSKKFLILFLSLLNISTYANK